jgi:glycosyltransferase involved in cell wall biosynthesis
MPNHPKIIVGIFTHDFFPYIGGQGRHVYEFYKQNALTSKISLFIFSPRANSLINHIQLLNRYTKNLNNLAFSFGLNIIIKQVINSYHLDIVHFQTGPGGLFLLRRLDLPVVMTAHHTYWQQCHYLRKQRWKFILFYLEKLSYTHADHIICVSEDTKNILINHYHINENRLTVIPNGIRVINSKLLHRLTDNNGSILYVGRIDERKGLNFLISAFECINLTNPNLTLHVVGTGKDLQKYKQYCNTRKLNIQFHGYIGDMELDKLYNKVILQVVPSVFEGFGLVVLEAMANGIPVIATNVDGIRCIIKDGYNGLLVDYGDVPSLVNKIDFLIGNPGLASYLSENAYNGLDKYKWENIYQDTVQLYSRLANK